MRLKRTIVGMLFLLVGPFGLFLALFAFGKFISIITAIWTGVFERPNYMDGTGDAIISRAQDPDLFWSNIQFWSFASILAGFFGLIILWSLAVSMKQTRRAPNEEK